MDIWVRLCVFTKILISFLVPVVLTNILFVLINRFTNFKLNQSSDILIFSTTLFISFLFSLIVFQNYYFNSKSIKIDDRLLAKENIKVIMKKMKWKTVDEDENLFTFRYSFFREFKSFKISIRFIDTQVIIEGPKQYVDKIIEMVNAQTL